MKFNCKLLTNNRITLLLTSLLFLMLLSAITLFFTPPPLDIIVSNFPIGFLQALPPILWITILLYSLIGSFIVILGTPSRFNQYYFLCVTLTLVTLKMATPVLFTKTPPVPDTYEHYKATNAIISTGKIPESGVYTLIYSSWWPGMYVFGAMFQDVSNLSSVGVLILLPIVMQVLIAIIVFLICRAFFWA